MKTTDQFIAFGTRNTLRLSIRNNSFCAAFCIRFTSIEELKN